MGKFVVALVSAGGLLVLGSAAPPPSPVPTVAAIFEAAPAPAPAAVPAAMPADIEALAVAPDQEPVYAADLFEPAPPPEPEPPLPPTPEEVLADGVLVVVSIASQRMFVLKDGEPWASSKVSTGKAGHDTPTGTFPILQKKVHHRSNLYDDAPMPYMQRLTWSGVALHAGSVPGYPASHGCIRMPKAFAKKLYGLTDFSRTLVVVVDEPLASAQDAAASFGGALGEAD